MLFLSSCWCTDQYEPLHSSNYSCRGLFAARVHLSPCAANTIRHKDHFIKRSSMLDLIWAIKITLSSYKPDGKKCKTWWLELAQRAEFSSKGQLEEELSPSKCSTSTVIQMELWAPPSKPQLVFYQSLYSASNLALFKHQFKTLLPALCLSWWNGNISTVQSQPA